MCVGDLDEGCGRVPWASLFPHGPEGVRWGEEISMDNLEDWLTLDMRVVFKWLAGETQVLTTAEATTNAAKRTTED